MAILNLQRSKKLKNRMQIIASVSRKKFKRENSMIENKELGVKFTESDEETAWFNTAENLKQQISVLKMRIKSAEKDMKMSAREIEQKFKNGAKKLIKQCKEEIKINNEFLKLAEEKFK